MSDQLTTPSSSLEAAHKQELQMTAAVRYIPLASAAINEVFGDTTPNRADRHSAVQGATDVIEKIAMRELLEDSDVDAVSGLLSEKAWLRAYPEFVNRSLIAYENGEDVGLVVLSVDMDNLHAFNEHSGHTAGDWYFGTTGNALNTATRPGDMVFRKSKGDEIGIILNGVKPSLDENGLLTMDASIKKIIGHINTTVNEHIVNDEKLDKTGPLLGVSIGGAHHSPGQSAEELFTIADNNSLRAKQAKRVGR